MSIYRFYFSSAPCGAGKTFQLVKRAAEWAKTGRRIIVLQPTKELIAKTVQQELLQLPGHPAFKVFNGDTVSGSVAAALTDYLKQPDDEGQIVFATHQVLPYIGFWPNKDAWDVLIDEEIQVHRHNSYEVPDTHRLMTDLIGLVPCNSIYSKVIVDHRAAMERIAKNEDQDEIYEQFRELAQTLVNGHWESFVNAEKYKKLKVGKSKTLSVHSVLNPSVLGGFGSVFMASANFTDTMVYRLWSQQGVEFREDQRLTESLRFQQHQNGHSITIKYADNRLWSKKLRLTKLNEKTTVTDAIVEAAIKEFQDRPFIWQANKNFSENPFGTNAKRLPNLPHGLNTYAVINNIVFLSSLNPAPDHFRFLKSRGVSGADVRRAIYCATAYQAVMRTSIRDRGNTEPKTVIVPDYSAALYLQDAFPGSRIEKLETAITDDGLPKKTGRPRKYQFPHDRKAAYRQRQKQKLRDELLALKISPYPLNQESLEEGRVGDKKDIEDSYTHFVSQPWSLTVYRGKSSNNPLGYVPWDTVELFISELKTCHERLVIEKEKNILVSPAIFDPDHPDREGTKRRGKNNIRYLQNIWLDFENGELAPEEIANLFPNSALVVINSYNHTIEKPRFRVIFLTSQQLTPEAYEYVWDEIAAKIADSGYWFKKPKPNRRPSGLDCSKRSSASFFMRQVSVGIPRIVFLGITTTAVGNCWTL